MTVSGRAPSGLAGLLALHRQTIEVGGGYWVAMRARLVPKTDHRPHGIEYSLTLHSPGDTRLLGYDNAHAAPMRTNPSRRSRRPVAYDHVHRGTRTKPYAFVDPGRLLEDFWADVEAVLKEVGVT